MSSIRIFGLALLVGISLAGNNAKSQDAAQHGIVALHKMPPEQWVEKVWGDPNKLGAPFVIRIHNDAGYVVLPHTHPMDENITVVYGSWSLGMGPRFSRSGLQPMELGSYGYVQKQMAHFAWSKTETIVQVHGTGPFSTTLVDPVYELTDKGMFLLTSLLQPGVPAQSSPPGCFVLKVGQQVQGDAGDGVVMGARCSPANQFTQYWVQKANGERFWATGEELKVR